MTTPTLPIECKLDAAGTTPADAERLSARVFGAAVTVRELPDGYRIQFRATPGTLAQLAEFVDIDRRCCAFLRHAIIAEEGGGPIWLELTGGDGAKEAISGDLVRLLPQGVRPC